MDEYPRTPAEGDPRHEVINLFSYLHILFRWKRFLLINLMAVSILVAIITLLIPNTYKSTASVIPP